MFDNLSIVVVGASGDLAKKKTFPSLFDLYSHGYIPEHVVILGYARSHKSDEELRAQLKPFLVKHGDADKVDNFLEKIVYRSGEYNDKNAFASLHGELLEFEASQGMSNTTNRLFYFAIPPNVFLDTARSIHGTAVSPSGWTRIVVEKPFGHDYDSCERLSEGLGELFTEDHLYRIDHYLGKEMVQNLICLRFANEFLEPLWNRDHVQCVLITFKEDFGTQGRGGYFDKSGIIRDILQNHLTQVLSLVAMEPPVRVSGPGHSDFVRDAKVQLLECIPSVTVDDVVLGQYTGDEKHEGYLDDTTVPNESRTPTFCSAVVRIHNRRWDGVPFILKAGKALDDRKAEIRVQFRQPPAGQYMFDGRVRMGEGEGGREEGREGGREALYSFTLTRLRFRQSTYLPPPLPPFLPPSAHAAERARHPLTTQGSDLPQNQRESPRSPLSPPAVRARSELPLAVS